MSAEKVIQKTDLQPRKKRKAKRKANSPLNDTGQSGQTGLQTCGRTRRGQNVSKAKTKNKSAFVFPDPKANPATINFSQQGSHQGSLNSPSQPQAQTQYQPQAVNPGAAMPAHI